MDIIVIVCDRCDDKLEESLKTLVSRYGHVDMNRKVIRLTDFTMSALYRLRDLAREKGTCMFALEVPDQ
jgi:hypothetical protein